MGAVRTTSQATARAWKGPQYQIISASDLAPDEADEQFKTLWEAEHGPVPATSLDDVLDHFDHVVVLGENHLRRLLRECVDYYIAERKADLHRAPRSKACPAWEAFTAGTSRPRPPDARIRRSQVRREPG